MVHLKFISLIFILEFSFITFSESFFCVFRNYFSKIKFGKTRTNKKSNVFAQQIIEWKTGYFYQKWLTELEKHFMAPP